MTGFLVTLGTLCLLFELLALGVTRMAMTTEESGSEIGPQ